MYGEATQHDVVIQVTVLDPAGVVAGRFDGSARDAEVVRLETRVAGIYEIEVASADSAARSYSMLFRSHIT